MKGFGKKVSVAFLSVVTLLAASGVISLFELSNLSLDTDEILAASHRDIETAKNLLSSAHDHSRAMMDVALFENEASRAKCNEVLSEIGAHIASVRSSAPAQIQGCLDTLAVYGAELQRLAESYGAPIEVDADSVMAVITRNYGHAWYVDNYEPAYNNFVGQVKRYISLSHGELAPRAEQLSKNAYRSVAPVLISLAVMIAIVLMLYYFVYIYTVKPILKMNRALADFLSFKIPYKTKAEMIDEVKELNESIEHLINASMSDVKQKNDAI
jgi:HAMP domain-containing protein